MTSADLSAKVILNQAQATGLPMVVLESLCEENGTCEGQVPVSALSNTVTLNHLGGLPVSGDDIAPKLLLGALSAALGLSLTLLGRRRRRTC